MLWDRKCIAYIGTENTRKGSKTNAKPSEACGGIPPTSVDFGSRDKTEISFISEG